MPNLLRHGDSSQLAPLTDAWSPAQLRTKDLRSCDLGSTDQRTKRARTRRARIDSRCAPVSHATWTSQHYALTWHGGIPQGAERWRRGDPHAACIVCCIGPGDFPKERYFSSREVANRVVVAVDDRVSRPPCQLGPLCCGSLWALDKRSVTHEHTQQSHSLWLGFCQLRRRPTRSYHHHLLLLLIFLLLFMFIYFILALLVSIYCLLF